MELPKAEDLRALLAAARDCGVTRFKLTADGGLDFEMAASTPAERVVDEINRGAPLGEDPLDIVRREAAAGNKMPARDMLEVLASGGRFVPTGGGDPTQPD
jgi:hypothetical protein